MPLTVSTAGDRPTPKQRIVQVLEQDRAAGEPTRIRIPVQLYDRLTKDYRQVPDMFWSLQTLDDTPDEIETALEALGKCLTAISTLGAEAVLRVLTDPTDPT